MFGKIGLGNFKSQAETVQFKLHFVDGRHVQPDDESWCGVGLGEWWLRATAPCSACKAVLKVINTMAADGNTWDGGITITAPFVLGS